MVEIIMSKNQNPHFHSFNLAVSASEEQEVYSLPMRKERVQDMAARMVAASEKELEGVLKEVMSTRFEGCSWQ